MSASCFIKLLAGALALAAAGYFIGPMLGIDALGATASLAAGLLLGVLVGGVATALYSAAANETETEPDNGNSIIYVGNLPFNVGKEEIKNLFAPYGQVIDIRMVKDRRSRRFKGYAFVEMNRAGANAAIKQLDNTDYAGRTLRINEAKKKDEEE